jgi:integrase
VFKRLTSDLLPSTLRQDILVDLAGVPRYWATIWSALTLNEVAPSTRDKKLRFLESLYVHADETAGPGSLDRGLCPFDEPLIATILESWFISIVNRGNSSPSDEARWRTGFEFVSSTVTWLSKSPLPGADSRGIELKLHRLSHLYGQLHVARPRQSTPVRSLPANVAEALYELLDPRSEANPFVSERTRWIVFISFMLMLHQGLRRGELLQLPADAVKSAYDIRTDCERSWLNVETNPYEDESTDPRFSRPSIKTAQSIRQLPVSPAMASLVQSYVENYRGRPDHAFLLNSQKQLPLSTESLTKLFAKASGALPEKIREELFARTGRFTVTPHDLRHTCAVVRLNQLLAQGNHMDEATQKLRTFFGWSRESTMPMRYASAVFEDRLSKVWSDQFDSQIEMLRALP